VILMTAYSAVDSAVESIRQGAYHYLTKPFKVDELALFLERALEDSKVRREAAVLRRALRERFALDNLVGSSAAMRKLCELIERLADAGSSVLIVGETGTGKGVVARAIHAQSERASSPFVALNCASVPEALLESELFGHVKGAFTSATSNRVGLLEAADGGTLFLDEIGEMALSLQAKLLHVLESGTVRAVGSNKERPIDVRTIAATHRDLRELVKLGTFREDLLYRLDVITIEVPPLRQRKEDLPELLAHFLAVSKERHPRSPVVRVSPAALARMSEYAWPGNVRELEHCVERLVVLGRDAEIGVDELPPIMTERKAGTRFEGEIISLREINRHYAQWAFEQLGQRKMATAEKLRIDIKTLGKLLQPDVDEEAPAPALPSDAR
jgi:two-component system response regulator HydG